MTIRLDLYQYTPGLNKQIPFADKIIGSVWFWYGRVAGWNYQMCDTFSIFFRLTHYFGNTIILWVHYRTMNNKVMILT